MRRYNKPGELEANGTIQSDDWLMSDTIWNGSFEAINKGLEGIRVKAVATEKGTGVVKANVMVTVERDTLIDAVAGCKLDWDDLESLVRDLPDEQFSNTREWANFVEGTLRRIDNETKRERRSLIVERLTDILNDLCDEWKLTRPREEGYNAGYADGERDAESNK